MTTDTVALHAEQCSELVVQTIKNFISVLRTIESFAAKRTAKPDDLGKVRLFQRLQSAGVIQLVDTAVTSAALKLGCQEEIEIYKQLRGTDDRACLVKTVLLPLLTALSKCYEILDKSTELPIQQPLNRKLAPPPPRAMLSIQNYTDIAALIELTVCTSILPNLEANVLASVQDRIRFMLPKSIAGRIPRLSLLWGKAAARSSTRGNRANELNLTASCVAGLVLLDRFRPMLLPRHIADLFAAVFQGEALDKASPPTSILGRLTTEVDAFTQARAYQTLLLKGKSAPGWLRNRVSKLLTELATKDLRAIVLVFVRSASSSQEDTTAAALRLARALTAVGLDNDYFSKLCAQLASLLDCDFNAEKGALSADDSAGVLTVWSVLDQFSVNQPQDFMLPVFTKGMQSSKESGSVHRTIRRFASLLAFKPPALSPMPVFRLLLAPTSRNGEQTLLGLLIRVASMQTVEVDIPVKNDALTVLRLLCFSAVSSQQQTTLDLLSLAIFQSVVFSAWDKAGYQYRHESGNDKRGRNLVTVSKVDPEESTLLGALKRRIDVVLECVAMDDSVNCKPLAQSFFHLLLVLHFGSIQGTCPLRAFQLLHTASLELSVMMCLPAVCDHISPEVLLLGGQSGGVGVLSTIRLLLECGKSIMRGKSETNTSSASSVVLPSAAFEHLSKADSVLAKIQGLSETSRGRSDALSIKPSQENAISTVSLVVSLLTTMLELGMERRMEEEEAILGSMMPALESMSLTPDSSTDMHRISTSGIAEMASHALALIASRRTEQDATVGINHGPAQDSSNKSASDLLREARRSLESDHPGIRARGVVSLRYLARGYLSDLSKKRVIVEVGEPPEAPFEEVLFGILRISIAALKDAESYVYLASVQTIVATADSSPALVLPVLVGGVCEGAVRARENGVVVLETEQRIKLAEALLFAVRRRGDAIVEYAQPLLSALMYGHDLCTKVSSQSAETKELIQERTHRFFNDDNEHDPGGVSDEKELLEQTRVRVQAGGPLFDVEEDDVLRSSCIILVGELLTVLHPRTAADYVPEISKLATDALVLDQSRLVRRAAASLCSSVYMSLSISEDRTLSDTLSMARQLALSSEDSMKAVLEHCVATNRENNVQHDPSVLARCKEALEARNREDVRRVLALASLAVATESRETPTETFVRRSLK